MELQRREVLQNTRNRRQALLDLRKTGESKQWPGSKRALVDSEGLVGYEGSTARGLAHIGRRAEQSITKVEKETRVDLEEYMKTAYLAET